MTVVGVALALLTGNDGLARLAYAASMLALVAVTPIAIVRRLISHPVVNITTITGAASIYLLFGLFWASVYSFIGDLTRTGHPDCRRGLLRRVENAGRQRLHLLQLHDSDHRGLWRPDRVLADRSHDVVTEALDRPALPGDRRVGARRQRRPGASRKTAIDEDAAEEAADEGGPA